ncbi:MAG: HNH endonuclease [Actinomycetia bacterium]|nr:HNH endonuclease [Actinomycetes bacterium]
MYRPNALPAPLAAVVEQVRAWARLDDLPASTPDERAAWVAGLQQLSDAVAAATLSAVSAFDAAGDGEVLHGAASTASWLRGALGVAPGEASERVRMARRSRDLLAQPVDQLRAGTVTYDHVRAIERSTRFLPAEQQEQAVDLLLDLATVAPVADVRNAGRHLRFVCDPDGSLADTERQFDRRYLTLAPLMDGMTAVEGLLDLESAALMTAALEPFLVPTGPEDVRTAAQRRADGLVDVVRASCDHRLLPVVGGERPHLQVLVATPDAGSMLPGLLPRAPGGPAILHPVGVTRVSCDAQVLPVLLDGFGVPTALGRTRRVFSADQRRLLALRDGHCRFPGCSRAPAYTDAHHVVTWSEGGATDIDNAALLCRFHHRLVHEGGWSISCSDPVRRTNGPITFTGPRGQQMDSSPRGP